VDDLKRREFPVEIPPPILLHDRILCPFAKSLTSSVQSDARVRLLSSVTEHHTRRTPRYFGLIFALMQTWTIEQDLEFLINLKIGVVCRAFGKPAFFWYEAITYERVFLVTGRMRIRPQVLGRHSLIRILDSGP